ncbi:MAG: T9SS type A sorting domain-containing protein [Bacteroidota bacterium]
MSAFPLFSQDNSCGIINGNLIVSNTNDDGPGSLRNAINCANELEGPNRIIFSISGTGRKNIFVGSTTGAPLPALSDDGTVIDGSFQPGATDRPRIVLDGSQGNWEAPINGLFISGNGCAIYALEIRSFPDDGVDIFGANNVKIGTPGKSNVIYSNGEERDFYDDVTPSGPWEGSGIALRNGARFCEIKSNFIGTDARSTTNFANEYSGILITGNSNSNLIGGTTFAEANIIAYNPTAIRIEASTQNALLGNSIICNDTAAISLVNNGNELKSAPTILLANDRNISGTGNPGDRIEIFLNKSQFCGSQVCQGQLSVGSTIVNRDSTWAYTIEGTASVGNIDFLEYDLATALATDTNGNTSNFSSCRVVNPDTETCADSDGIILVTNTADDGAGSLRAAIECANATSGANQIQFNIEGNRPYIIRVGESTEQALPALTDNNTIIDASTQTGFGGKPVVILEGDAIAWTTPINAIWIRANNCEVYGLEIRDFPDDGIDILDANNVTIGSTEKPNVIYDCGSEQDIFPNAIPRGNWEGCGIVVRGSSRNARIFGNKIGTNYEETQARGNEYCGISIAGTAQNITIGGAGQGNTIANNAAGILLADGANNVLISQNVFTCNDTVAIALRGGANASLEAPIIENYTSDIVRGTATPGALIEVFISSSLLCPDRACQGNILLGTTTADGSGAWELTLATNTRLSDETSVTATATTNGRTSAFADCFTKAEVNCSAFTVAVASKQDESCDLSNGSFSLSVTGGTAPYTYDIGNGPSLSPNFTDLSVGTYSVTVSDANGCEATQALAINQSPPLSLLITEQENAICGQATGQFVVLAFGSVAPYTYDIGNGSTTNFVFENLSPGEYEVTVTDAAGCTETEPIEILDEDGLQLELVNVQDASCGENNGSVIASTSDGIAPIVFRLNGQRSDNPNFDNLAPGTYELVATDANGCTAIRDFVIEATPELRLSVVEIINANCDAQGGGIELSTTGGTAPFTFDYGNGVTNEPSFKDLRPGTYLITATDANGCTDIQSARVEGSGDLTVEINDLVDASCDLTNGSFTVVPVNGQAPYSFDIGDGNTSNATFTDLAEGEYTVTVSDAQGCETTHDITIGTISPLNLQVVNVQAANCAMQQGGSFTLLPSGGTLPITYDLGTGSTSNPFFFDLAAGDYVITATDALGCMFEQEVSIPQTGELTVRSGVRNATCGQNNGLFRVASSTGEAPHTLTLNGETYTDVITGLSEGIYTVLVTDANGCSTTVSFGILDDNDLEASIRNVQNARCGQSNGQFTVTADGGDAPYRYDIGLGETTNATFSDLSGGFYEVTVTDLNGCATVESILVEESAPVSANIANVVNASCQQENGGFTVEVTSGVAPYSYNIGFGATDEAEFVNLPVGTYDVTVTDADNCETVVRANIDSETVDLFTTIQNIEDATCGEDNGSFEVDVSSGTAPYTFSIGNGEQSQSTFIDLAAGGYTVVVTDASGCSSEHNLTIIQASEAISAEFSAIAEASCGQSNGGFTVTGSNGSAPYRYDIGFGATVRNEFTELSGGVYEVTVTDIIGCTTVESIEIEESAPLAATIINTTPTSCGLDNGTFEVNVTSGTAPYAYDIGNGFVENAVFADLAIGSYEVTIRDVNGCETTQIANVLTTSDALETAITDIQSATCGEDNGAFSANVSNGQAPYSYTLNGETFDAPDFADLPAGDYILYIFDSNGCSAEEQITIDSEGTDLALSISDQAVATCGQSNGAFTIDVNGGQAPFTYDIGFGEVSTAEFTQMSGGVYEVSVTDNLGCTAVTTVTVEETDPITFEFINTQEATCGADNASFDIEVSRGTAPFAYNIGNGFVENPNFQNLPAGTYQVTVRDLNGCENTESITLGADDTALTANVTNIQAANCAQNDGRFTVNVTSGIAPYTFDLGQGETNNNEFTNLEAGNYTLSVSDANGCSTTLDITIESGTEAVTGSIVQQIDATCGRSDGSFSVQATSGVAPFSYDIGFGESNLPLFTDLSEGVYNVTITDVNGCSGEVQVILEESSPITAAVSNLQPTTCGEANGSFQINVNSGAAPYTFDYGEGGTTNNTFNNLSSGSYEVTVTDVNFCSTILIVEVEASATLEIGIGDTFASSCGEENGSVLFAVTGGVEPFTYELSNGETTTSDVNNLVSGDYSVTVTDSLGCTATNQFSIESSGALTAELIGPSAAFCGTENGSFAVNVTSGAAPYRYDIGEGTTSDPNFGGLSAGTYTVTITDANDCTTTLTAEIETSSELNFSIRKEDDFCGNGDGMITIVTTGGTSPYTYDIGDGPVSSNEFFNVFPGTYYVTVTDANGCESVATIPITATSDLNVAVLSRKLPTCNENNGRIVVSAGSGVAPYTFDIGNGPVSSQTFENLAAGDYVVTIIDAVACEATVEYTLESETETPTATITDINQVSCAGDDGSFSVNATGGQSPYTYSIGQGAGTNPNFTNLSAGDYNLVVTDANGCAYTEVVSIIGAVPLSAAIISVVDESCDKGNGTFQVEVSGGTAPYRYDIGDGLQASNTFSFLVSGSYIVSVVDARDCETTQVAQVGAQNDLEARLESITQPTCAADNGSFTVVPSGGEFPFRYDIGDGFVNSGRFENLAAGEYDITVEDANGCQYFLYENLEGSTAPSASLSVKEDATCGNNNGRVVILAFGGREPYTYNIGNGATLGNDFDNLSSGSYDLTITDANGCISNLDFVINDNGELPTANFVVDTSGLEIELTSTSTGYDSLRWSTGDGSIYRGSSVLHEFKEPGSYLICLETINECGIDEICQNVQVTSTVLTSSLGGFIFTETNLPVADVMMTTDAREDPIMTDIDGIYSFERLVRDSSYLLTPSKNTDPLDGVTTYDIFLINNHILAKERLDSPYKIIAADVNQSGSVSTFDVVLLRKLLLGLIDEFPEGTSSWRFVAANYEFEDPAYPLFEDFPEEVEIQLATSIDNANFVGVKMGDVNNSIDDDDDNAATIEGRTSFRNQLQVKWQAQSQELILSIPAGIVGLQGAIEIGAAIETFTPSSLADLGHFGLQDLRSGLIRFSWNADEPLATAQELARIKLKDYNFDVATSVRLQSTVLTGEIYTATQAMPLELAIVERPQIQLLGHAPNPFREFTNIQFELSEAAQVQLRVLDVQGRLQQQQSATFDAGEQQFRLERDALPAGVFFYEILVNGERVVKSSLVAVE